MNEFKKNFRLITICYFFCSPFLIWSSSFLEEESFGEYDQNQSELVLAPLELAYFRLIAGRGIGYNEGYATLGLFYKPKMWETLSIQPFFDFRTHFFRDGRTALNVGTGARYFSPCLDKVFGLNFFYDFRKTHWCNNQLGVGFEMLGNLYDVRINGYFPIGKEDFFYDPVTFNYPGGFVVNSRERRQMLRGVDMEFATSLKRWINCSAIDFWVGAGPYYYEQKTQKNIVGGQGRVGLGYQDWLTLEVRTSYDPIFHQTVQGVLSFNLLLNYERSSSCNSCCCSCQPCCYPILRDIADEPVQRQEIIAQSKRQCCFTTNFQSGCNPCSGVCPLNE